MTPDDESRERLTFLVRVVTRERDHLVTTDRRLFAHPFSRERALGLDDDVDQAERVEAFVSRFGRLQDTIGDKLLPAYLVALGEQQRATVDILDRAEKLELIPSADTWLTMRKLRNQMVHEYIEDPEVLASALQAGHEFVPVVVGVADGLLQGIERRGWLMGRCCE